MLREICCIIASMPSLSVANAPRLVGHGPDIDPLFVFCLFLLE